MRSRAYSAIPASHQGGLFAEISASRPLGNFRADIQGGVRASSLFNLPKNRLLHGRVYADPRLNLGLTFPPLEISGRDLTLRLTGGVGWHTKMPTLNQLFPDKAYLDLVELNYYHAVKEYRRVVMQTYVVDPTNTALRQAFVSPLKNLIKKLPCFSRSKREFSFAPLGNPCEALWRALK